MNIPPDLYEYLDELSDREILENMDSAGRKLREGRPRREDRGGLARILRLPPPDLDYYGDHDGERPLIVVITPIIMIN